MKTETTTTTTSNIPSTAPKAPEAPEAPAGAIVLQTASAGPLNKGVAETAPEVRCTMGAALAYAEAELSADSYLFSDVQAEVRSAKRSKLRSGIRAALKAKQS
jgi:hypothetical protein